MTDQPEVYVVHHHDIEKRAEHFNEGFDEAHRQGVGGQASRDWLIEKVVPLLKDHVDPESLYHVAEHIADALLSEADLGEPARYTAGAMRIEYDFLEGP